MHHFPFLKTTSLSGASCLMVAVCFCLSGVSLHGLGPAQYSNANSPDAVLSGRVMHRGDTLRIGAELLDVARVAQIWGAQYNRKFADIFAVQEEIAREISEKLRLRLSGEEKKRLKGCTTRVGEAYQLYLKAQYFWHKWTPENLRKAVEYNMEAAKRPSRLSSAL